MIFSIMMQNPFEKIKPKRWVIKTLKFAGAFCHRHKQTYKNGKSIGLLLIVVSTAQKNEPINLVTQKGCNGRYAMMLQIRQNKDQMFCNLFPA